MVPRLDNSQFAQVQKLNISRFGRLWSMLFAERKQGNPACHIPLHAAGGIGIKPCAGSGIH
jgi:hypothetical protein